MRVLLVLLLIWACDRRPPEGGDDAGEDAAVADAGGDAGAPADCRETPCTGFTYCDLNTGECKPGCSANGQCGTNEECALATHACVCAAGHHRCSNACVPNASTLTCGSSCDACPDDPNGDPICDGTSCGLDCDQGYIECDGACVACADPHGTPSCEGGACKITCDSTFKLCGGACRAQDDPAACGTACTDCTAEPNVASATCSGGECVLVCAAGHILCGGHCIPCADPHGTPSCDNGACKMTCGPGYHACGTLCAANTDARYCGAICYACPNPTVAGLVAVCENDTCGMVCPSGKSMCRGQCVSGACNWNALTISQTAAGRVAIDTDTGGVTHLAYTRADTSGYDALYYASASPPSVAIPEEEVTYYCASGTPIAVTARPPRARLACSIFNEEMRVMDWLDTWWGQWVVGDQGGPSRHIHLNGDRVAWTTHTAGKMSVFFSEFSNSIWTRSVVQADLSQDARPVWMLGGAAEPRLAYGFWAGAGGSSEVLRIATRSAANWAFSDETGPAGNMVVRARADGAGVAAVYRIGATGVLRHAEKTANGWRMSDVGTDFLQNAPFDFVIDGAGRARVVYLDTQSRVRYVSLVDGYWLGEVVQNASVTGLSLDLTPQDAPVIAAAGAGGVWLRY